MKTIKAKGESKFIFIDRKKTQFDEIEIEWRDLLVEIWNWIIDEKPENIYKIHRSSDLKKGCFYLSSTEI